MGHIWTLLITTIQPWIMENRAITIDEVPLEWCYGKGVKFDFRSFSDGYVVNVDDIKKE